MNVLPPLRLLEIWRVEEGLTPEQVYRRSQEWVEAHPELARNAGMAKAVRKDRPSHNPDEERIKELRAQGMTWEEIGKELNRPPSYGYELARNAGIPTRITEAVRKAHPPSNTEKPPYNKKLPDDQEMIRLSQNHTGLEIAEMYSVSFQAVHQVLRRLGINRKSKITQKRQEEADKIKPLVKQGLTWKQIGSEIGRPFYYCSALAKEAGIYKEKSIKPIGCPECDKKHYAKGLCRNCYARYHRRKSKP